MEQLIGCMVIGFAIGAVIMTGRDAWGNWRYRRMMRRRDLSRRWKA